MLRKVEGSTEAVTSQLLHCDVCHSVSTTETPRERGNYAWRERNWGDISRKWSSSTLMPLYALVHSRSIAVISYNSCRTLPERFWRLRRGEMPKTLSPPAFSRLPAPHVTTPGTRCGFQPHVTLVRTGLYNSSTFPKFGLNSDNNNRVWWRPSCVFARCSYIKWWNIYTGNNSRCNYILCPVVFIHKGWRFLAQGNKSDFYAGVVLHLEKGWNDFYKILYSASLQNFVQLYTIPGVLYYRNYALQGHKYFILESNSLCGGPLSP